MEDNNDPPDETEEPLVQEVVVSLSEGPLKQVAVSVAIVPVVVVMMEMMMMMIIMIVMMMMVNIRMVVVLIMIVNMMMVMMILVIVFSNTSVIYPASLENHHMTVPTSPYQNP